VAALGTFATESVLAPSCPMGPDCVSQRDRRRRAAQDRTNLEVSYRRGPAADDSNGFLRDGERL